MASLPLPVQLVGKGPERREPQAGRDAGVHNNGRAARRDVEPSWETNQISLLLSFDLVKT